MDDRKKELVLHRGAAFLFALLLYGIHCFVFLYGDDYMYGSYSRVGIFASNVNYYLAGNGRFWLNITDSLLLSADRWLYILLNPLLILAFLQLLAKNVLWITDKHGDARMEQLYFRYGMGLFACLDILCLRETVFWITGAINYLLPATVFLCGILCFQRIRREGEPQLCKKLGFWFLCVLASSSAEQYALMFVGFETILLAEDLLRKRRTTLVLSVGYFLSLAALASLLLAPGNITRIDQQSLSIPSVSYLWGLIYKDCVSPAAFPLFLMLQLCCSLILLKENNKKGLPLLLALSALLNAAIQCVPVLHNAVLISLIILTVLLQFFVVFVRRRYPWKRDALLLSALGICSQLMLLVLRVWGYRCIFSLLFIYMLLILLCFRELEQRERLFVLCSGILSSFHPLTLPVFWLICIILYKSPRWVTVLKALCSLGAVLSLFLLFAGYAHNAPANLKNRESALAAEESGALKLYRLPDEPYSWYFFPMHEFHLQCYLAYYGLPESTTISFCASDGLG